MIKLKQKIESFNMSNSKLSNLLGKNHDYISDILRKGTSTANQNKLMQALDDLMDEMNEQDVPRVTVAYHEQEVAKLNAAGLDLMDKADKLEDELIKAQNSNAESWMKNRTLSVCLDMAERDKGFMKRKLHSKDLVINWLIALNVFLVLFLVTKYAGWVL